MSLELAAVLSNPALREFWATPPQPCTTDTCKAQSTGKTELYDTNGPDAGKPSLSDIHQGGYGDCYFLASLGALAQNDPQAVKNMIRDNGNGTYTVTFHERVDNGPFGWFGHHYQDAKVTVSAADIPDNSVSGSKAADGTVVDGKDGKQVIWPRVIEAAYAKLHDTRFVGIDLGGGYHNIGGGGDPQPVLQELTGHDAQSYKPSDVSTSQLQQAFKSGKLITLCTPESDGDQKGLESGKNPYSLEGGHCYTVTKVYQRNGQTYVTLNNPWGFDQPQDVPVSALGKVADEIAIGSAT